MKDFEYWWKRAYTWESYKELIKELLEERKTTGPQQSEELYAYAKLNWQRMQRIEKTFKIDIELSDLLIKPSLQPFKLLVITEGWCGDAAQSVPVAAEIARLFPEKVDFKVILRDTDTDLIDQFLTNGGRSIPVFIFLDENNRLLGHWGPRPKEAQVLFLEMKAAQLPFDELGEKLHGWYAKDKTHTLQKEIVELISSAIL